MSTDAQAQTYDEGQLVTFRLGEEELALPLELVQEIVRPSSITKVPGSPDYIKGISNLRGSILPVMDLRDRLSLDHRDLDDDTRIVVLDCQGKATGIIVDSVSEVMHIEDGIIESPPDVTAGVEGQYLHGVVKANHGKRLVMILSADRLLPEIASSPSDLSKGDAQKKTASRQELVVEEEELLVTFRLGEEEFAVDIMKVQEIIRVTDITQVPKAPPFIRGVMSLRNRLLPIVDLRRRFSMISLEEEEAAARLKLTQQASPTEEGHAQGEGDAHLDELPLQTTQVEDDEEIDARRIVVISLDGVVCGLQVDSVSEVLRMAKSQIEPPPTILSGDEAARLKGVCKLNKGERLLMYLDTTRLFSDKERKAVAAAAGKPESQAVSAKAQDEADDEDQMVCFRIMDEEFGIEIMQVREIIRIDDVTKVPQAPNFVEGIVNLRGQILPVIDLRCRFGLAPIERSEQNRIVVVTIKGRTMGVIVDSVSEVIRIPHNQIEEPPSVLSEGGSERYIKGLAKLMEGKRIVMFLDVDALMTVDEASQLKVMNGKDNAGTETTPPLAVSSESTETVIEAAEQPTDMETTIADLLPAEEDPETESEGHDETVEDMGAEAAAQTTGKSKRKGMGKS